MRPDDSAELQASRPIAGQKIASCTPSSLSDPTIAVIVPFVHVASLIGRAQASTARCLYEGEITV
ncbi:hypothetical protein J2Z31_000644 [Sinorhizobium kostiense]|uniref:Uncharacterized protein n=1 Tax=Sinorhizobium kostiense TaxID=76747 RepID=A0ABS4QUJ8_9HYPH|nr:hypothetical protein [Sinorhizobium kostiense]